MDLEIDENLKKLMAAHPRIFRGQCPDVFSYVSQGWYEIIDKLCADIEDLLGPERCAAFEVRQIKEKFGTLRFYWGFRSQSDIHVDLLADDGSAEYVRPAPAPEAAEIRELVTAAEEASGRTCEKCGAPGSLQKPTGWYMVVCDRHLRELLDAQEVKKADD